MKALHLPLHSWQVSAQPKEVQPCPIIEWVATPIVAIRSWPSWIRMANSATSPRVDHQPGAIQAYLESLPTGTPVALESVGNWYWIADKIEAAGCVPLLTHPAKAKVMIPRLTTKAERKAAG